MAVDRFSAFVCDLSGPFRSLSVPAGRLLRSLRPISAHRLVPALTLSIFPLEECRYFFFFSGFAFVASCVLFLCPPAEVKAPVEVPVEVCLSEVSAGSCKRNHPRNMTFRERGTRPEPQTHTLTFETYDLMWERGAQRGAHPNLSPLLPVHDTAMARRTSLQPLVVLRPRGAGGCYQSMNGTFHTHNSPFTHTWGQFRVSNQPNVPVFGPGETQHGLHLRRSGLELDPEPSVSLCTPALNNYTT